NIAGNGGELPEFINAGTCSWNLFATLGVNPALGRLFTSNDDQVGAGATAILAWNFFKRRYNADPAILGKTIHLNGRNYTVVGVLPASFQYPDSIIQLWVPWQTELSQSTVSSHFIHIGHAVARLKASASPSAAIEEVNSTQYRIYNLLRGSGPMEQGVAAVPLLEDMVG